MVPTEVLAVQHMEAIQKQICEQKTAFLCRTAYWFHDSETKNGEACGRIVSGESQIIIGTHAVFQEKIQYKNLALVITDEQHRFGVRQRESLSEKGRYAACDGYECNSDPKDTAVILYGDLDISVVNETSGKPSAVKNCVVDTSLPSESISLYRETGKDGASGVYHLSDGGGERADRSRRCDFLYRKTEKYTATGYYGFVSPWQDETGQEERDHGSFCEK